MATITVCDICYGRDNVRRRSYFIDRKSDAAGSMSDEFKVYDICTECELRILRNFVKYIDNAKVLHGNINLHILPLIESELMKKR